MPAELPAKLRLKYLNPSVVPTPSRIQKYVDSMRTVTQLSVEVGFDVPSEVLQTFINKKGVVEADRLNKFKVSVSKFAEEYGGERLVCLEPECIRKNGSINGKKFRKLIREV